MVVKCGILKIEKKREKNKNMTARVVLLSKRGFKPDLKHHLYFQDECDAIIYLLSDEFNSQFDVKRYTIEIVSCIGTSRNYKSYNSFIKSI